MLETFGVAAVIHCGDIGSTEVVRLFGGWPTHFVFGNVDADVVGLDAAIRAAGQTSHGLFGTLDLGGRKIAFLHGHEATRLRNAIDGDQWDLVCYGHTHVAETHRQGRTLVLNPGAIHRARPHSLAIVDLHALEVTSVAL
jgi:putative phosphoesterase